MRGCPERRIISRRSVVFPFRDFSTADGTACGIGDVRLDSDPHKSRVNKYVAIWHQKKRFSVRFQWFEGRSI
jgi:hypothetical protein